MMNRVTPLLWIIAMWAVAVHPANAGTVFVEAETFTAADGWVVQDGVYSKRASGQAMLSGGRGASDGVATLSIDIKDAGHYRIWVRYSSQPGRRGPFQVTALAGDRDLGSGVFDTTFEGRSRNEPETWKSFEAELPEGPVTLRLSKHGDAKPTPFARLVDCLLLTMDDDLVPNHLHYGAQTYLRVTLGAGYELPVYFFIFADHYHAPWYQRFSIGRSGGVAATHLPKKSELLNSGEQTAWCNITPLIYQDSGAMLAISARHTYTDHADRLRAKFEFATAPNDQSIVRTFDIDSESPGFSIFVPPNLLTDENVSRMKTDREIADEIGKQADAFPWPTHGKARETFPFFVTAMLTGHVGFLDTAVTDRELKTLAYFGYADDHLKRIGGMWHGLSHCQPDLEQMKSRAARNVAEFRQAGGDVKEIVFSELMDEPTGHPLEFIAQDPVCQARFREWIQGLGMSPADLLVEDWEAVKPVTTAEREAFPALYYFSQRFRTHALGEFMATQRKILEQELGRSPPTVANFSDGAIYSANFYAQGVDYFELLDGPEQNAIWGEDWANRASTYQCASYNVDLMRGAARQRGQTIGHHLIAHAGRKPWDVKLKATSELARGVKIMNSYCYGPSWLTHEGGPYWASSVWYARPNTWAAYAALTREVGAVEDMLMTAMPAPAKTAVLYSSSSDIWTIPTNLAYGFDRMHTWLALAHAQVPTDLVSEQQVADDALDNYQVCYLTGTHLSRTAAEKLSKWVERGGTLWLAAGAASRDEYNRPLDTLNRLLPAERGPCAELQAYGLAGKYLRSLRPQDQVRWDDSAAEVLSAKQSLAPREHAEVRARFGDDSPALVVGDAGKGRVYCVGFLPGLAYIKHALDARFVLEEKAMAEDSSLAAVDRERLDRSDNPWDYPGDLRAMLLSPVRDTGLKLPIVCDVPLVDAVYMPHATGLLVPLANYTNQPIERLSLTVQVPQPIARVESAVHGAVPFTQPTPQTVELSLPLDNNDFLKMSFP